MFNNYYMLEKHDYEVARFVLGCTACEMLGFREKAEEVVEEEIEEVIEHEEVQILKEEYDEAEEMAIPEEEMPAIMMDRNNYNIAIRVLGRVACAMLNIQEDKEEVQVVEESFHEDVDIEEDPAMWELYHEDLVAEAKEEMNEAAVEPVPEQEVKADDGMVEWVDTLGRKCRAPYVMDRETYGLYRDCLEHGGRVMKDLHWPTVQEFRITSWDMLLTMIVNKQTMAIVPYVLSMTPADRLAYAKVARQEGDAKLGMPGYRDGIGGKNPSNISNFYSNLVGRDGMVGMYPAVHIMDAALAATRGCHVCFGEFIPIA